MTTKEALHRLIDELPDDTLPAVERYLVSVRDDPVLRSLMAAPEEDEELSPDEEARMVAAWERHARGEARTVSNKQLGRDIGA